MASYSFSVFGVDLAKLQTQLQTAALPVTAVNGGAIGSPDVYVITSRDLTPLEVVLLNQTVATHDGRPRQARPLLVILNAILALTPTQQKAIGDDLFGVGAKWSTSVGPNRGSLFTLYCLTQIGLTTAQVNAAKPFAAALYVQDNPLYLVSPSFLPAVNIPGDEVIAAPAP